jgi:predicted TIM-barrel fold metal-dependent hydrolase
MKVPGFIMFYILMLTLFSTGAAAMETKSIIDIHCHIAGIGAGESGCFVSERLRRSWKYRVYLKAFGVTEKELLREGDGLVMKRLSEELAKSRSVAQAVVLAMDGVVGPDGELDRAKTEIYIPDEFVAMSVRLYPNLLFGASINPYRRDALERLDKAAADGAVLVKWLPSIQNIDPSDERLIPFYRRLKALGLPLLVHTGTESSFTRTRDELGDPERLRLPLSLGVTVIAAHAACNGRNQGEQNYERFLRLCREYSNLYADISALTQINRLACLPRVLKQRELSGRLLYGTDMPLINTGIVSALAFPFRLSPRQMIAIARIENSWDRDVALKAALGVPDDIFTNAGKLLNRQPRYDSLDKSRSEPN